MGYNIGMETGNKKTSTRGVHRVLAHSYTTYLVFLLIGICFDFIFKIKILGDDFMLPFGFFFLLLASVLIIWAQKTSRDLRKIEEVTREHFRRGPYQYTRSPTNWGLFFLMLGFGIIANAFFVILTTIISFFIARFIFVDKQEKILAEKYGTHYTEYKKSVRL